MSTNTQENVCYLPPSLPSTLALFASHQSWKLGGSLTCIATNETCSDSYHLKRKSVSHPYARALHASFQGQFIKNILSRWDGSTISHSLLSHLLLTLSNRASFLHWNWAKQDTQPMISMSINSLINKQIKHCWFLSCLTSSLHLAPLAISFSLPRFLRYLWHHTILRFLLLFCFPLHLFVGFMLCCLTSERQTISEWR